MKEKKIFDAITDVRDDLIEEAKSSRMNKSFRLWQKVAILAACVVLVVAGILLVPGLTKEDTKIGPLLDVVYP